MGHALNTKAVAKRYAKEQQRPYQALRLIIVHMGSGVTVSAHQDGRMIDSNTIDQGPFGPDRSGGLPARALVKLCFSGKYSEHQVDRQVFGDGGLFAYLGTRDLVEVERRIDAGDPQAAAIFEAMVYQIGKEAAAMAAVLKGKVDAILLSGGMAYSARVISFLRNTLAWIAPIEVYPGEDELQALAEGVFRVLDGDEQAKHLLPEIQEGAEARANRTRLVIGLE
jgi:butyrate kinase